MSLNMKYERNQKHKNSPLIKHEMRSIYDGKWFQLPKISEILYSFCGKCIVFRVFRNFPVHYSRRILGHFYYVISRFNKHTNHLHFESIWIYWFFMQMSDLISSIQWMNVCMLFWCSACFVYNVDLFFSVVTAKNIVCLRFESVVWCCWLISICHFGFACSY